MPKPTRRTLLAGMAAVGLSGRSAAAALLEQRNDVSFLRGPYKRHVNPSLRPREPARSSCALRQELRQGLHKGAAAALGALAVEAPDPKMEYNSASHAGQIGRMPIVAATNSRAWRAAGRAAPMITAGMGVYHEPIGASR